MNTRAKLLASMVIVGGVASCSDADRTLGPPVSSSLRTLDLGDAPLVRHLIAPQATDPAIDQFLSDHYTYLDTTARSNHRLLVFMPGTGQRPDQFQLVLQEAARLGYHVIGLSYFNAGGFAKVCPTAPDPAACYEQSRLEVIDGVERSIFANVNAPNSIDNRVIKLLQYLAAAYPAENWTQYMDGDAPKWPLIAVGGLSQGGGEAAMIARFRLVDRVVLFSSVTDSIGKESVPWVAAPHVTPIDRYYVLAHDRDAFFPAILAACDSLGLTTLGPAVAVESNTPPYGWTHILHTDLIPVGGFVGLNAHASTGTDAVTPLAADGTPALADAWRYVLSALPRRSRRFTD